MGRVSSNAGQGRHPAEGSHRSCDLGGDPGKNGVFGMQMSEPSWEARREPVQEATGGFRLAPGPSSGVPSISWLLQTPSGPAAAPRGRGTAVASVWLSPIPGWTWEFRLPAAAPAPLAWPKGCGGDEGAGMNMLPTCVRPHTAPRLRDPEDGLPPLPHLVWFRSVKGTDSVEARGGGGRASCLRATCVGS